MIRLKIIPLGVKGIDEVLGGGFPHPTLISIEGDHGTGKSAITQQMIYAALREGLRAYVITTETRTKEYLSMMDSIRLNPYGYFMSGKLRIYPLHVKAGEWSESALLLFMNLIRKFLESKVNEYDIAAIDNLSILASKADYSDFLSFVTKIKSLVSEGKTVILTFHYNFISENLIRELRASSDAYIVLRNTNVAGMSVKSLEVVKIWGTGSKKKSVLFEVDPKMGLRVVPIAGVKI
ncbi:MAG: ATPase domain-containing protein [Candidatus Bathyarchaeia archaeon]